MRYHQRTMQSHLHETKLLSYTRIITTNAAAVADLSGGRVEKLCFIVLLMA